MLLRHSFPLAISGLLLCGLNTSCKSIKQPPPVTTAGMRVDVVKGSYSKSKDRVDVRVKVWNEQDQRISFALDGVRLLFNGKETSAKPVKGIDASPDVQAKSSREFNWYFEVSEPLGERSYTVEIRDIQMAGLPLGDTAQFSVNVAK